MLLQAVLFLEYSVLFYETQESCMLSSARVLMFGVSVITKSGSMEHLDYLFVFSLCAYVQETG